MPVLSYAKIIPRPGLGHFLGVLFATRRIVKQAKKADGFLLGAAGATRDAFYTMSIWTDEAAVMRFTHKGAHGRAARKVAERASAHVAGHVPWDDALPDWQTLGGLLEEGTLRRFGDERPDPVLRAGPKKAPKGAFTFRTAGIPS